MKIYQRCLKKISVEGNLVKILVGYGGKENGEEIVTIQKYTLHKKPLKRPKIEGRRVLKETDRYILCEEFIVLKYRTLFECVGEAAILKEYLTTQSVGTI